MTFTILVTEPTLAPAGLRVLQDADCRVLFLPREHAAAAQLRALQAEPVHAIIARGLPITAEAIQTARHLKVISRHGVGYNHVDVAAATAAGVAVLIASGANAQSVAELAIGLMIAAARGLLTHDAAIRAGGWLTPAPAIQLSGRALGIVGIGAVGQKVARLAQAIGMAVAAYDPYIARSQIPAGITQAPTLDALLDHSEILSLHCPLTSETASMIGPAALARLRPGAILINTARGPVIDQPALIAALQSGHLAAAGLDTFDEEPLPPNRPIAATRNTILTPHIGGSTGASLAAVSEMAATNALRALRGEPLPPGICINPPA